MTDMSLYQQVIHQTRYARWNEEAKRRETWDETTQRYVDYFDKFLQDTRDYTLSDKIKASVHKALYGMDIMPSMRTFMTAGKALDSAPVSAYNCAYLVVDSVRSFSEHMYVLMCGTGSGFSVEKRFVDKLPEVPSELHPTDTVIVVADSRKGWCVALNQLMNLLYAGSIPKWDVSKVRPEGARLKTFGGYSSGPGVLEELFRHIIKTFEGAKGRKMRPIEVFSIMTYIAQIVVVGGVRRCQRVDDCVFTDKGLVRFADLAVGDRVVSLNKSLSEITAIEPTGKRKLLAIRTRAGELKCTPEHRVAVVDHFTFKGPPSISWKEARDLKPGIDHMLFSIGGLDAVATQLIHKDTPTDTILHSYYTGDQSSNRGDAKVLNVAALSLEEWAWLVGYLHGDGHVYMSKDSKRSALSFAVAGDMPETRAKLVEYLTRLGTSPSERAHGKDGTWYVVRLRARELELFLSQWKLGADHLEVPEFVMRGDESIRLAYVAGVLDADGSCKSREKRQGRKAVVIVATTTRPAFFRDLKAIVSSLGATFGTRVYTPPEANWSRKYTLVLNTSVIKDRIAAKMRKYSEKIRNDYDDSPYVRGPAGLGVPRHLLDVAEYQELTGRRGSAESAMLSLKHLNMGDWMGELPAEVLEVVEDDEAETVDISVKGTECYVTNGHLVHNSATICLFDKDDAEMRVAKSGQWWVNNGHFAMANISAVFEGRPRSTEFMDVWKTLVASGSGEPGVLNRKALWDDAESIGRETREPNGARIALGVNPSLRSGTRVLTSEGVYPIESLAGKDILVPNLDGTMSPAKCFLSGKDKPLWEITLKNGQVFYATAEHEWPIHDADSEAVRKVRSSNMEPGQRLIATTHCALPFGTEGTYEDGLAKGWSLGDESTGLPASVWSTASEPFRKGLIAGLYAACGLVGSHAVTLSSMDENLVIDVQDLLALYGVETYLVNDAIHGSYSLRVTSADEAQRFVTLFSVTHADYSCADVTIGGTALRVVESVRETDLQEDVWDITVYDSTHCFHLCGVITGNCSEISLRPNEFCNLTGASIRPEDTLETLLEKVKLATILGTWQACIDDFDYLRKVWTDNVEDERLLGVCLAGIMDHPVLSKQTDESAEWYQKLRDVAWETNKTWAKRLKINTSASVTAVKPAGNSGELHNVASGIHPRYAPYYIRTIRQSAGDPMTQFLKDNGIPWEVSKQNPRDIVFSFPIKSPEGAVCAQDLSAIEQLDHWMHVKTNYTTHTVSCTVYVRDHEWMEVGAWVYANFDKVTGISFLPYDDHTYQQAPYQPITHDEYVTLEESFPKTIDWGLLAHYEGGTDTTTVSQDYACVSGACALT